MSAIQGNVIDVGMAPAEGVTIRFTQLGRPTPTFLSTSLVIPGHLEDVSDALGNWRIEDIAFGNYLVEAIGPEGTAKVEIPVPDDNEEYELKDLIPPNGLIYVPINPSARPIERVTFYPEDHAELRTIPSSKENKKAELMRPGQDNPWCYFWDSELDPTTLSEEEVTNLQYVLPQDGGLAGGLGVWVSRL